MPDASQWRTAANYDHVDTLSASSLAWEWLRRNEAYCADFEAFAATGADTAAMTARIREHWRLRFPGKTQPQSVRCVGVLAAGRRYQRHHPCTNARSPGPISAAASH